MKSRETQKRNKDFVVPTETLKEVIKHRPPVAQVVREITEESERDKIRQKRRENMTRESDNKLPHSSAKANKEEDEAQKVYREIMEVVGSTPCGRGRMVGYGEEAQTTLRRGDRSNAARLGTRHHNRSVNTENISI